MQRKGSGRKRKVISEKRQAKESNGEGSDGNGRDEEEGKGKEHKIKRRGMRERNGNDRNKKKEESIQKVNKQALGEKLLTFYVFSDEDDEIVECDNCGICVHESMLLNETDCKFLFKLKDAFSILFFIHCLILH